MKELYPIFNLFELEMSRLCRYNTFMQLTHELKTFNDELEKWRLNKHDIKNIVITYHLYENLFSRLRVTLVLF